MVESLKLSITDQQLPMFIRIMELGVALYYGEIGGHKEGEGEETAGHARDAVVNIPGERGTRVTSSPATEHIGLKANLRSTLE